MINHNRNIYYNNEPEVRGSGLVKTSLKLSDGVIQPQEVIKEPPKKENIPEDVLNIIKKIRSFQEGSGFKYI